MGAGPRADPGLAPQTQAVRHHEDARQRHGQPGQHRVHEAQNRQRQGRHVVGEGPEQVGLDGGQCALVLW